MAQVARNVTMAETGLLAGSRYLVHDRDRKYCEHFRSILEASGVKPVKLPARSPNLNPFAERWVQSAKREVLSKLVLFGEAFLRRALAEFQAHYHEERNHQGNSNVLLFPSTDDVRSDTEPIRCRERLGGLLRYYHREAG